MLNILIYYICASIHIYIIMYAHCVYNMHNIYVHMSGTYMYVSYSSASLTARIVQRFLFPVSCSLPNESLILFCVVASLQVSCRCILAAMAEAKTSHQGEYYSNSKYSSMFQNSDVYLRQSGILT